VIACAWLTRFFNGCLAPQAVPDSDHLTLLHIFDLWRSAAAAGPAAAAAWSQKLSRLT
jgi:hypothetical protein